VSLKRLRGGELLGLAGAICLIVALFEPWYEGPIGKLDAWDTFGGAVILLLAALFAALAMVFSALTERSTALPVSTAVWCVLLGFIGVIAAIIRVIERPDHASSLCIGAWLGLAGAVAILTGAWQVLRDERPSMYEPMRVEPRPRP
jgi:drug/metabolite transporter (DMT)-like permease